MSRSRSIRSPGRRSRSRGARRARATEAPVLIRSASPADAHAIDRLSILDDRILPPGERLVGEVGGRVVAALDVSSGTSIADPFVPTVGVLELLDLRAAQVRR
jgi:hypothetical protein